MTVYYEWDVEEVDKYGDIQDHYHSDNYSKCLKWYNTQSANESSGFTSRIVLVRDDDKSRSWAYMVNGDLPLHFEDANGIEVAKVPKRFHDEVKKNSK